MTKACVDAAALCWIEAHPGLAAWLQMVFSVVAIVAAFLVPLHMARHERAVRQAALRAYALHASAVVVAAVGATARMAKDDAMRATFAMGGGFPPHVLGTAEAAFNSINMAEIEDMEANRLLRAMSIDLQGAVVDLAYLRQLAGDDEALDEWSATMQRRAAQLGKAHVELAALVHPARPSITQSLKSFPAWLRTTWTGLPLPWRRQKASTAEKA